jgi:hypothetical protein
MSFQLSDTDDPLRRFQSRGLVQVVAHVTTLSLEPLDVKDAIDRFMPDEDQTDPADHLIRRERPPPIAPSV